MLTYFLSLSAAVGLWWLAMRLARNSATEPLPVSDPCVWLDERDQRHFAGMYVGIDAETSEIVSWSSRRELVERDIAKNHSERQCRIISVPLVESDPIRVLLSVGPCKLDDGNLETWCEGRR